MKFSLSSLTVKKLLPITRFGRQIYEASTPCLHVFSVWHRWNRSGNAGFSSEFRFTRQGSKLYARRWRRGRIFEESRRHKGMGGGPAVPHFISRRRLRASFGRSMPERKASGTGRGTSVPPGSSGEKPGKIFSCSGQNLPVTGNLPE
jgi:hypothetical protein